MPAAPQPAPQPEPCYHGTPYGVRGYAAGDGLLGTLDPLRLLHVLRKKWLTVAIALLLAGAGAAHYLSTTVKIYRATSLIEMSLRRPRLMTQQAAVIEDPGASTQSEEIFNTRLEKFKSRTLAQAAAERLLKDCPDAATPSRPAPSRLAPLLARVGAAAASTNRPALPGASWQMCFAADLKLTLLRRTRLVRAEFDHPDPAIAAAACNAFADAAVASAYDENRVSSDAAVVWMETQAGTQRKTLGTTDDALLKFRQDNKIDILESQRKTVNESLLDFNTALVALEGDVARTADLLAAMNAIPLTPENAGKLPASIPRADEIRPALDRWLTAITDRNTLLGNYTPKHPEVRAKSAMVELYRAQATEALVRAKATVTSNLALLQTQAESLSQKKAEQARLASDLDLQIVERKTRLSALERERDVAELAYRGILNRIQEARLAADETTATLKIAERATAPSQPVSPRPARIVALALLLGLMGGLGLALLQDSLGDQVAAPGDIEATGMAKVVAVIPHDKGRDRYSVATSASALHRTEFSEAFAGLRLMLESPQYKAHSRVVLLASTMPTEGKTVTACNLALTCARHGEKTLLIDFDLRRPRLVGVFPLPPGQQSLVDFLVQDAHAADPSMLVYTHAGTPGLSLIAGRAAPHSHSELLSAKGLSVLLGWARTQFDRVILDGPPLGVASDSLALAAHADTVLVVARHGRTRKRMLRQTLHLLREAGVGTMALILNDVRGSRGAYGYGAYPSYAYYKDYADAAGS